ncbi:hypothetical protein P153DRAFT_173997 [Dothidotthia symphoricarpi CBS 119687]|uniref:Uncharacterized protein n=1 Tax=Dothidotthia symphoricarpi CBS 119687 TaxID=1392245 RepID=A0A6A6AML5_9PLEO|nr:uncharacterized protein P153DRAFT_173997 [Dothidotthia symphoricarpi CBS 119687]KAF2132806.1 hypothetical protein P153DRAFT_173997 [Dothidotthia symphoricarpi CBS 119687]
MKHHRRQTKKHSINITHKQESRFPKHNSLQNCTCCRRNGFQKRRVHDLAPLKTQATFAKTLEPQLDFQQAMSGDLPVYRVLFSWLEANLHSMSKLRTFESKCSGVYIWRGTRLGHDNAPSGSMSPCHHSASSAVVGMQDRENVFSTCRGVM